MARAFELAILLLSTTLVCAAVGPPPPPPTDFIKKSCKETTYPRLCEQCLSSYAPMVQRSPRQLARVALSVSAARARAVSSYVAHLSAGSRFRPGSGRGGALKDCLEMFRSSTDQLRESVSELQRMGRKGSRSYAWHLSNIQTWVSAALTNENTCLDSLSQDASVKELRSAIRARVVDVARTTSNALALVARVLPRG